MRAVHGVHPDSWVRIDPRAKTATSIAWKAMMSPTTSTRSPASKVGGAWMPGNCYID